MMSRDDSEKTYRTWLEECLTVKNSSLEKILMVMLAQLEGGLRDTWGFRYDEQNQEGEDILNFAIAYDLMVANTFFRKKKSHLITFSSSQHSSWINFVLTRRRRDQTAWIVRLYLASVLSHNTNFWWLIFVFRYAFGEIEA
jgi:hypothetical protein